MDYRKKIGTKEKPLVLKTPPLTSEYTMHVDEKDGRDILVCTVKSTVLHYDIRCLDDLYQMLKEHGDWMLMGSKDEKVEAKPDIVEFWGRSKRQSNRRMVWVEKEFQRKIWHVHSSINGAFRIVRN